MSNATDLIKRLRYEAHEYEGDHQIEYAEFLRKCANTMERLCEALRILKKTSEGNKDD